MSLLLPTGKKFRVTANQADWRFGVVEFPEKAALYVLVLIVITVNSVQQVCLVSLA